ncbi:MAG: ComF family protein [Methyloligellaceae bacterium]
MSRSAASVSSAVRSSFARISDVLLPPLCLSCRSAVEGHGGLCPSCWSRIDFIQRPLCERLGIPLPYAAGERIVSAAALADPPVYDRARAAARYDGEMRKLVHDLKYRDSHEGVELFARWLAHAASELLADADVLIPVPLARLRLWRRRFNQSALLAAGVARLSGVRTDPFLLERVRRTASQVGLTVEQRRRNVAGAFAVHAPRRPELAGRNVVLVDDVITTGATANACARALRRAGAARVDVLALARVVNPLAPNV